MERVLPGESNSFGEEQENHVNYCLDSSKDKGLIKRTLKRTMIKLMSTQIVQILIEKVENLLQILEKSFNGSIPLTNNNLKGLIHDFKNKGEKDLIDLQVNYYNLFTWFLLIPIMLTFHICHFYINVTLFIVNKPPLEFQDIKWFLENIRLRLKSLRVKGTRQEIDKKKNLTEKLQPLNKRYDFFEIFSKWPIKFFIEKLRELLNFVNVLLLPSHNFKNLNGTKVTTKIEEEEVESSYHLEEEIPRTPLQSRRVSVTVQEIIFEETEDSLENAKESVKNLYDAISCD